MMTRVSVEVAKEWVFCQPFKLLINEGEREVIFPGSRVELPVVNTHPPTGDCPLRYELISLISDNCHASLLWDHLNWVDPLLTVTISRSDRQLLRNKSSFTLCSIHILFNSNKFHKFWISFDFRSKCIRTGRNWVETGPTGLSWASQPGTSTYMATSSIQGQCDTSIIPLSRGLDVSLIK